MVLLMKDKMSPTASTGASTVAPSPLTPAGRFSNKFKRHLCSKHAFRCQYCGSHVGDALSAPLDHIVPRSKGGSDDEANLRLSCRTCNSIKRDHDLEHLRWCLRVRRSVVGGIILPKQARALADAGIDLQLGSDYMFEFERRGLQ